MKPFRRVSDFIQAAKKAGAEVTKDGTVYTVKTPKGKITIKNTHDQLDKQTVSNLSRWFKTLGILFVIFLVVLVKYSA